jgi:phospholipase/lecithinase/hemolysin
MRFFPRSKSPHGRAVATSRLWRRWAAATTVLLAACGGGTSQYEPFVAGRVLVVGDDLSALTADGRKYAVNGINADGTLNCAAELLWVQNVAAIYGHVFKECNPTGATTLNAIMRAAAGAKVADIAAQVVTQEADGGFRSNDLVLALGGSNDILELYQRYPAESSASLLAEARARGERMAGVVNRVVELQAKVIVSTVPDLGLSPFARTEDVRAPGSAALLSELTRVFNERLGVKVLLDGRFVGLMQSDLRSQLAARFPSGFGLADAGTAVCTAQLPGCTTATLLPDAAAGAYFWADGTRLASGGQNQLASLAIERATRNPF